MTKDININNGASQGKSENPVIGFVKKVFRTFISIIRVRSFRSISSPGKQVMPSTAMSLPQRRP